MAFCSPLGSDHISRRANQNSTKRYQHKSASNSNKNKNGFYYFIFIFSVYFVFFFYLLFCRNGLTNRMHAHQTTKKGRESEWMKNGVDHIRVVSIYRRIWLHKIQLVARDTDICFIYRQHTHTHVTH